MSEPECQSTLPEDVTRTMLQAQGGPGKPLVWYCPSRWLLAHSDLKANIQTLSSHMCLADLNNDGENLLALVDFKEGPVEPPNSATAVKTRTPPPCACRMRVYRGQQMIYNHFLEDVPACLIASSISLPLVAQSKSSGRSRAEASGARAQADTPRQLGDQQQQQLQQPLLTLAINEDVYFYHKLRPSHKFTLEDDQCILDTLNKSEVDAWQMARQNKLDDGTMRELLLSLSQELGEHALTSHSINYIALSSSEERKQYLVAWKLKRFNQSSGAAAPDSSGEQIMSMDTICCAAARLKYSSSLTTSGDYGQTRERATFLNTARWNKILDIQRDGLLLGTEDRHLLIYELRPIRTRLEAHLRLPAVPDHILVERRSPASFDTSSDLRALTYKILISCRDRQIYSLDAPYLVESKSIPCGALRALVALKSNVLDMCWTGMQVDDGAVADVKLVGGTTSSSQHQQHRQSFIVACLDRRFYCFSSHSGQCKWIMELELPITCLVCLPKLTIGCDEASLIGIASRANRFDFYVASTGRIVDSIYFRDDYPTAAKFGRFGREDNCLCVTTSRGHLLVFILKRTVKFAHGQCLSSAASYASETLASCSQVLKQSLNLSASAATTANKGIGRDQSMQGQQAVAESGGESHEASATRTLNLGEQANLPSAFALSKLNAPNVTDKIMDSLILSHDCNQVTAKQALDTHATRPQMQIPMKGRDFVNQTLDQARHSRRSARVFGSQMINLRDKIKATLENQSGAMVPSDDTGSRVTLTKIVGLGNTYRVNLALRLNVASFVLRYQGVLEGDSAHPSKESPWHLCCYLTPKSDLQNRSCQVYPFESMIPIELDGKAELGIKSILETLVTFKLTILGQTCEPIDGDQLSIEIKVIAYHSTSFGKIVLQRPLYLESVNIPLTC